MTIQDKVVVIANPVACVVGQPKYVSITDMIIRQTAQEFLIQKGWYCHGD